MTALIKKIFFWFSVSDSVPRKIVVTIFTDEQQIFEVKTNACVSYVVCIEHNFVMNYITELLVTYLTQATVNKCSLIYETLSAILPLF